MLKYILRWEKIMKIGKLFLLLLSTLIALILWYTLSNEFYFEDSLLIIGAIVILCFPAIIIFQKIKK